jgi:hypothetical protein
VHTHPGPVTMSGTAARLSRAASVTRESWIYVLRMVSPPATKSKDREGRGPRGDNATARLVTYMSAPLQLGECHQPGL